MAGYRRKPRRGAVHRQVARAHDRGKIKDRSEGKASAKKGDGGRTYRYIGEVKKRDKNENALARPNGLLKKR